MINLRPCSGLCNRLRAMNGAYWLARRLGCRLNVFWRVDDSMNTRFSELFEVPEDMSLIEMKPESYFSRGLFSWLNPFANPVDDRERFVRRVVASKGWGPWALTEYAEFYRDEFSSYSWLRPVATLQKQIDEFRLKLGDSPIGVHIRRTDNEMSIKYSPLILFEEKIREELEKNPRQKFFLATDDVPTKSRLLDLFGDIILTRQDIAVREAENGVRDAAVDLILLASCSKLYGSYYSSFSEVAAAIGDVPFVQLRGSAVES